MKNKNVNAKKYFWITLCFFALITTYYYATTDAKVNAFIRFDERQIIGHSKAEIIEKYGKFDKMLIREHSANNKTAKYAGLYRLIKARDWQPTTGIYYYYWVSFSEDDIALAIRIEIPPDEQ